MAIRPFEGPHAAPTWAEMVLGTRRSQSVLEAGRSPLPGVPGSLQANPAARHSQRALALLAAAVALSRALAAH